MTQTLLQTQAKKFARPFPEIRPGYTVRVHQKVLEGGKERVQVFEGLVISVHRGRVMTDGSFMVRRVVEGIGVEKVFPVSSPNITKIEVMKVAPVRRAKLFFLRGRKGKAARLSERFTTAGEFAVAVVQEPSDAGLSEGLPAQGKEDGTADDPSGGRTESDETGDAEGKSQEEEQKGEGKKEAE